MKKYIAEFIGTFTLVFVGCGTAMLVGCDSVNGCGYVLTALAFGLTIVAMAYSIGNISGCHINPAVSLAMLISGKLTAKDFCGYVIAQILGALAGSACTLIIPNDMTGGMGTNGLAGVNGSLFRGCAAEVIMTCIFLLAILGVTSDKAKHGSFGGLVIGLSLVLVHLIGIGLTGCSVNPARSIGPAIVNAIVNGSIDVPALIVFIVGPCIGAAIAALVYKQLEKE
ncbi:MAG: aquaporin [Oscillospiraceae bacterium]|nr:aquaporin [Oscillospiraceae bacterium]